MVWGELTLMVGRHCTWAAYSIRQRLAKRLVNVVLHQISLLQLPPKLPWRCKP
jgi:hypothetical protein